MRTCSKMEYMYLKMKSSQYWIIREAIPLGDEIVFCKSVMRHYADMITKFNKKYMYDKDSNSENIFNEVIILKI